MAAPRKECSVSGFLDDACAAAHARVRAATGVVTADGLRAQAVATPAPPGFGAALATTDVTVIAEVKRASPSRGAIADIPDPAALARSYADGGAGAVSVLTEPRWFRGSLDDLSAVSASVAIPALRKDFVVDAYQVWEARAAGASAVLLIVAGLDDGTLSSLIGVAADAGLDALVEVHDAAEARRASAAYERAGTPGRPVIGVNARDLDTLQVDPARFGAVRDALPAGALAVAESGVRGPDDVRRLADLGADAVLVGEHVALASDPAAAVRALVAAGRVAGTPAGGRP